MKLNIRIAWPAWMWLNSASLIVWSIFSSLGYHVIADWEYSSIIKWWLNFFDLNVSDESKSISKFVDILVVFDDKNLKVNLSSLKSWAFIISNEKFIDKLINDDISLSNFKVLSLEINDKYNNTYLLWILFKLLWIDKIFIKDAVALAFTRKWKEVVEKNQKIINDILSSYDIDSKFIFNVGKLWKSKEYSYWNKAIAYGAIYSWLNYFSAYPMTPASTILSEIINSKKVNYLQAEDELATINSALWASFTWARSMVATSGWWFALMIEALSFAVQAEIPIVVILSQRAWPSTWAPTMHEAWDLNLALNPTFWDFNHICLCPSTLEEWYYFWWLSLNLSKKYQSIVILLTDKQFSDSHASLDEDLIPVKIDNWKILKNPPKDYRRYELTNDGVSPMVKVGIKNGDFIATSYEHDEYWETTEDPEMKKKMTEKRFKKLENFFEKEEIRGYETINTSTKKIIITFSFISYNAKEFVRQNPDFWLIIIKFLKPLDERLLNEIKWVQEIIFVENNYSGQLEGHIVKELWLKNLGIKISHLRKYNLMPFYIEDFEKLII